MAFNDQFLKLFSFVASAQSFNTFLVFYSTSSKPLITIASPFRDAYFSKLILSTSVNASVLEVACERNLC